MRLPGNHGTEGSEIWGWGVMKLFIDIRAVLQAEAKHSDKKRSRQFRKQPKKIAAKTRCFR